MQTIYYQFSGPQDEIVGFDDETLKYLIHDCYKLKNVVVIASDLTDFHTTDFYFERNRPWFDSFIESIKSINLIDGRCTYDEAHEWLAQADCIHLMGGITEAQDELLSHFKITCASLSSARVVMGTSAGAMAMGSRVLGTRYRESNHEGLNCGCLNILPHCDSLETLRSISEKVSFEIVGLRDDTGIRYDMKNNAVTIINQSGYFKL